MNIIRRKEMADALKTAVSSTVSNRFFHRSPGAAMLRLDLDGAKFIETDYRGTFRGLLVECFDAFFLASYAGSFDRFQVRVR